MVDQEKGEKRTSTRKYREGIKPVAKKLTERKAKLEGKLLNC